MIQKMGRYVLIVMAFSLVLGMTAGCGSKEEKAKTAKPVMAPGPAAAQAASGSRFARRAACGSRTESRRCGNCRGSGRGQNDEGAAQCGDERRSWRCSKNRYPPINIEQAKTEIRKGLIDEFCQPHPSEPGDRRQEGDGDRKGDRRGHGEDEIPTAGRGDDGRIHEEKPDRHRKDAR